MDSIPIAAFDAMPNAIGLFDASEKLIFCNSQFHEIYDDVTCDAFVGQTFNQILQYAMTAGRVSFVGEEENKISLHSLSKILSTSDSGFLLKGSGGRIFEINCVAYSDGTTILLHHDITEHQRNESAARVRAERATAMLDTVFDGIVTLDSAGEVLSQNTSVARIFGTDTHELKELNISDMMLNVDIRDLLSLGHLGQIREFVGLRSGAEQFPLEVVVNKLAENWFLLDRRKRSREVYVATVRDISHSKKVAKQLQQAQKMDAIGILAGGIAHDFNNILSIIMGYGSLLKDVDHEQNETHENVEMILQAAERGRDLISRLLSFSRQGAEIEKLPCDSRLIVREVFELIRRAVPVTIDIRTAIPDEEAFIVADASQIHQVLVNLCNNAVQAIAQNHGRIDISAQITDSSSSVMPTDLAQGDYIDISVSDTGSGIDSGILDRIFEPFFTTKAIGKGSGLGLSMVHGIVAVHGGKVTVESEQGAGATFHVYLPLTSERPNVEPINSISRSDEGEGRVLLVDDEELIVRVSSKVLSKFGYEVVSTTDGLEALRIFRADPDKFSVVITDQSMPTLTGDALIREIRLVRPDIPVVLCTGYTENIDSKKAQSMGIDAFVMKPLDGGELCKVVLQVLEARAQGKTIS